MEPAGLPQTAPKPPGENQRGWAVLRLFKVQTELSQADCRGAGSLPEAVRGEGPLMRGAGSLGCSQRVAGLANKNAGGTGDTLMLKGVFCLSKIQNDRESCILPAAPQQRPASMLPPIPTLQSSIKVGRNGALGTVVTLGTLEG